MWTLKKRHIQVLERFLSLVNFYEHPRIVGRYQCLLPMSLTPIAVVCGSGGSYEEAQKQATFNALHYLKLMTRRIMTSTSSDDLSSPTSNSMNPTIESTESASVSIDKVNDVLQQPQL